MQGRVKDAPKGNLPPSLSSAWFPSGKGWCKLYKYTHRTHAEALALRGEIRLGTLFGYRKVERFAPRIGDRREGIVNLTENVVRDTGKTLSDFGSLFFSRNPGLHIEQTTLNLRVGAANCWLFCTSEHLGERTMRSTDPTYDACVQINHVDLFRRIIANELIRRNLIRDHNRAGTVPCVYRELSRPHTEDDGISPVVLKDTGDADQEEVRYVFIPREPIPKDEDYLDLVCPALARCCHLVEHVPA